MNEIEAIRLKLQNSNNIFDLIDTCKLWRTVVLSRVYRRTGNRAWKYQLELSDKMIEFILSEGQLGDEIIALFSRQSGKTEAVAFTVLTVGTFYIMFLKQEFLCGLFAPVESMTTHVTRNRVRKMYNKMNKWLEDNGLKLIAGRGVTSSIFILKDKYSGAEFYIRALSVGEQSETIGESFKLMIIEQSELVNALKLTNDVFPMGAAKGGIKVLTGTTSPYFKNDYFKSAIQKYNEDINVSKSTADIVMMVDYKRASRDSTKYARYCKKMKDKLGEDNLAFKTQFGLEWASAAVKFIGWEKLAPLEEDYIWNKENLRFYGIDVARAGDSTVVTVIEKDGMDTYIIAWLELEGLDFEDYGSRKGQITKIVEFLMEYKPLRFGMMDRTAIGIAPFDMFKKRLWEDELNEEGEPTGKKIAWTRVAPFKANVKLNDKMSKSMDREFQHDRIHYPKHTKYRREKNRFIDQILDVERKYSGHTLKLEAPKQQDRHDDYPISLGLAIYAMKEKTFKGGVTTVNL